MEKTLTVIITAKNGFSLIATGGDVIERSVKLYP